CSSCAFTPSMTMGLPRLPPFPPSQSLRRQHFRTLFLAQQLFCEDQVANTPARAQCFLGYFSCRSIADVWVQRRDHRDRSLHVFAKPPTVCRDSTYAALFEDNASRTQMNKALENTVRENWQKRVEL